MNLNLMLAIIPWVMYLSCKFFDYLIEKEKRKAQDISFLCRELRVREFEKFCEREDDEIDEYLKQQFQEWEKKYGDVPEN